MLWLVLLLVVIVLVGIAWTALSPSWAARAWPSRVSPGPHKRLYSLESPSELSFDVLIVGAGPAGATHACYLQLQKGRGERLPLKVGLLDRATFPRKKFCGDAWCEPALAILEELAILDRIKAAGVYRAVERGGFISPSGFSCVGGPYGTSEGQFNAIRTWAMKREHGDEFIVRRAAELGAQLFEATEVADASFRADEGVWSVRTTDGRQFSTRCLVLADGSNSQLARKLGVVEGQPTAVCSHQYVSGTSHAFEADGTMLYTRSLLPGYSALFKHFDGDCYLGTYILPGGEASSRWIGPYERNLVAEHPYVRDTFQGRDYGELAFSYKRTTAPIRIGGVPRSFDDHLLVIGDAAGLVDPATGEGIHTAMISGVIAADVVLDMFREGDFSSRSTAVYHHRWFREFGFDFRFSTMAALAMHRMPLLLDAMAVVGKRQGQPFLDLFGAIMTGVKPKYYFLKPGLIFPIALEILRQIWRQKIWRESPPMRIQHISQND